MSGATESKDLQTVISFEGFDHAHYYRDERTILEPRLQELGYCYFSWRTGERDSFGPLIRCLTAATLDGEPVQFWYGRRAIFGNSEIRQFPNRRVWTSRQPHKIAVAVDTPFC